MRRRARPTPARFPRLTGPNEPTTRHGGPPRGGPPRTLRAKGKRLMAKSSANKIRPLDDRVVIEQIEAEEKTAGGIVLPDTAKEKPQRGRVLAVGPGRLLDSGERSAVG